MVNELEKLFRDIETEKACLHKALEAFDEMADIGNTNVIALLCVAVDYCAEKVGMRSTELLVDIYPKIADINDRMGVMA